MGPDLVDGFGKVVSFGVRKRRKEGGDRSVGGGMENGKMRKVSPFEGFDVEKLRKEAGNGHFGVGKRRKDPRNGDFGVGKRRKGCGEEYVDGRMEEETGDVIKVKALGVSCLKRWRKECWNWSSCVGEGFEKGKRSPVKVEALEGSGRNLRCGNWSPGELGADVDESLEKEMENMIKVAPPRGWSQNLRRKEGGNWSPGESGTGVDESEEGCSLKVVALESSDVDRWTIEQENRSLSGLDFDVDEKIEEEEGSSSPNIAALDGSNLCSQRLAVKEWGNRSLAESDPDIYEIMEKEKQRQVVGIELVASENYVCKAVLEALGSHLTNKYSEGAPGARYYCGNPYIDQIERLCQNRAIEAFGLDPECWGVNVQPYSCTSANFAVFTGLLLPKDRIMGLDSPSGGHVSHGLIMPSGKKVSGTSIFFENLSYKVNPQTGLIDYDKLEEKAVDYRPKVLICGGSSYPREWDYARFRKIAYKCGAVLMCDMAHISGLVAAKECSSPFNYCDIVTSTTHKSLRGPRGGIIFFRKGKNFLKQESFDKANGSDQYDFEERINFAVFPSLQGGPHNNHIAALAIALKQVVTPEYKAYIQQVKRNAQALATALCRRNCRLVTGGTDNHLILWDLRNFGLTGKNFEKVCEMCHITVNKTPIFGDNGTISPAGVRIGTPAMTTRGCLEEDFELIAEFLLKAVHITSIVQREHGKLPKNFLGGLHRNGDIVELRSRVEAFSSQFAMPGFDV